MEHAHDLTRIAIVALAAMLCGIFLARLRQPAIVGYILAGVILGPSAFGFVSERASVGLLAELGIIMLLFVIGLELSVRRFAEVWRVALVTTLFQIGGSLALMLLVRQFTDWSLGLAVLLGYVVALSSTAVVIKLLEQSGELALPAGRLTLGILIAQDMAVVPMLLSLGALAGDGTEGGGIGISLLEGAKVVASVVALAALVLVLLRREIKVPFVSIAAGHHDLAPLAAFAYCFGGAAVSGLLGLSPGYGAFVAGLILGNSRDGARLAGHAHPIQAILLMVFFLSVGLLLDLAFLWDNLGTVLFFLLVVTVFKTALNVGALRLQRVSWNEAFLAGVALAQIGEFSFLLSEEGVRHGLLRPEESQLVIAVTVLSLIITPLWSLALRRLGERGLTRLETLRELLAIAYGPEARRVQRGWRRTRVGAWRVRRRLGGRKSRSVPRTEADSARSTAAPAEGDAAPVREPEDA